LTDDFRTLMEKWLEQQQAYWAQLSDPNPAQGTTSPWQQLFDTSKAADSDSSSLQQHLSLLLAQQAQLLNQHGEALLSAFQAPADGRAPNDTLERWLHALQQQATGDAQQRWKLPDSLTTLLSPLIPAPHPMLDHSMLEAIKHLLGGASDTTDAQDRPGQHQHLLDLLMEYQSALQHYLTQISLISQQAAGTLCAQLDSTDAMASSLTALHDLWVEHYEQAYQEQAFSKDFQNSYGRLSNARMHLQQFAQRLRDAQAIRAGLATQQQLQLMRRDAHQLRKQVRRLQHDLSVREAPQPPAQAAELAALRAEVSALRTAMQRQHASPPASRKRKA
jgi:hypothetical protein